MSNDPSEAKQKKKPAIIVRTNIRRLAARQKLERSNRNLNVAIQKLKAKPQASNNIAEELTPAKKQIDIIC